MTTPTITQGSLLLLKTQVMADVPEGGGAVTGDVIADGGSNTIFPDISDLDRAIGAAKLRQIAVAVRTLGNPVYMGANLIIAQPPADPRVSVTLFAARPFERRSEAVKRVESYLTTGPEWAGYLLENHLQNQRAVQIFQRENSEPPLIGQTLVLTQNEGLSIEKQQYVRVISASSVVREFTDEEGKDYKARVVTCEISDLLRVDFAGSPPARKFTRAPSATKIRESTVADAGAYASTSPLAQAAELGDFGVQVSSIFTQLVPTAQVETPISDLRVNGLSFALVATGGPVTMSLTAVFSPASSMHVGGPVYPGSLSIVRSGVTVTDRGSRLISSGQDVGAIDYDNGICTLSVSVFGDTGGTHQVTFVPAAAPDLVSDQRAILVTAETRSLSYTFVMEDIPVRRTLNLSYLAQGRWYVLRDDGSGALRGSDAAFGVGTLSYTTGSVSVTLGALPDVGSSILVQSYSNVTTVAASNTLLQNGGKVYVAINSDGDLTEERGSKSFAIGSVQVTWTDGTPKTATDDGAGGLNGDATGQIDYTRGVVRLSPNALPPPGTVFTLGKSQSVGAQQTAFGVAVSGGNLGATNITPGSVSFDLPVTYQYTASSSYALSFTSRQAVITVSDDGAGNLRFSDGGINRICGTINYATGALGFALTVSDDDVAGPIATSLVTPATSSPTYAQLSPNGGLSTRTVSNAANANVSFTSGASTASDTVNTTPVNAYAASTLMVPNYTLKGVRFRIGAAAYAQLTDGTLLRDINPTTGGGTPAGSVFAATGRVSIGSWPAGASPVLQDWRGLIAPPAVGVQAPFTAFSTVFRTAASPLRVGSVSVLGTMQDGTTFNLTADSAGKINGTRVKGRVNYQHGLIELFFVNPAGDAALNVDLSFLGIPGVTTVPADLAMVEGLRYNAVSFSYLPLDAALIGIDPVRLPSDGRAPIFRKGGVAVVGHTGSLSTTVSNGQTINCARVRLSHVQVLGADGLAINTGYSADLEAGLVTFDDVTGYAQPVTIRHRIEDMAVVSDVTIDGQLSFTRPLTHDYPLGSYVSSAIMGSEIGSNLSARVSLVFDQQTWGNVWADTLVGNAATGTFAHAQYPITTTNAGAVTERFAARFLNSTTFELIGENLGVVGGGNTAEDFVLLDPVTGQTRLHIPALGWGLGWAAGNVLRINTVDAMLRAWALMTVRQGPATVADDSWYLLARGSVDTP